ncbi:peptidylprolyl isomerase [bacterium]|nr:peptidylprolyl isomerase [bacterium]
MQFYTISAIALAALISANATFAAEAVKDEKPETGRWAVIETNKGTIKFALYEKDAPITTKNFIELANSKFYDGLTFHRVVPGFVIQGGDPNGDGTGGSPNKIKLEVSPKLKHDAAGVVAMARASDPNSASCQFYITLAAVPYLDMNYAVFGRVVEGLDVVKKIQIGDVMKTVRIVDPPKPKEDKK